MEVLEQHWDAIDEEAAREGGFMRRAYHSVGRNPGNKFREEPAKRAPRTEHKPVEVRRIKVRTRGKKSRRFRKAA